MHPDYFQNMLAAAYPALARYAAQVCTEWPATAVSTASTPPGFMAQLAETPDEHSEHLQRCADEIGDRAEKRLETFRRLARAVDDAYGRALSHRRLEHALARMNRQRERVDRTHFARAGRVSAS